MSNIATPLVIMGDEVGFTATSGDDITLPVKYVITRDPEGRILSPHRIYFMAFEGPADPRQPVSRRAVEVARMWYGEQLSLQPYAVLLPDGPWDEVTTVQEIRYRRLGKLAGPYRHRFRIPIMFLRASGKELGWRMDLPENAIIDERGFVDP